MTSNMHSGGHKLALDVLSISIGPHTLQRWQFILFILINSKLLIYDMFNLNDLSYALRTPSAFIWYIIYQNRPLDLQTMTRLHHSPKFWIISFIIPHQKRSIDYYIVMSLQNILFLTFWVRCWLCWGGRVGCITW